MKQIASLVFLRVKEAPQGDAPKWVRKAWVGLRLPMFQGQIEPVLLDAYTTKASIRSTKIELGRDWFFVVPSDLALDVLMANKPKAWEWWNKNALPKFWEQGSKFLFNIECGEIVKIYRENPWSKNQEP